MKLLNCYISSFGKLQNFFYSFSSGLNTIIEDNGWGKSTFATFIKAMFYGLNSSKRSVSENERIKYRPWNSTQKFGGYIEFLWGENHYKIERFFGAKEAEDTLRLFDVKTGKEFSNTENLGKRIFEIDEEGFLSTTYFSQKDFEIKSNSSLTAKFNSVCEVQDTEAFDKALLKLEEKAKTYKYRGDKGLISETKREIANVDYEIERTLKSAQTVKLLKAEVENLEKEVETLKQTTSKLTEKVSKAGEIQAIKVKKEHYEQLLTEKKQTLLQLDKVNNLLNGNAVTRDDVNNFLTCNQDLLTASTNVKILSNDIENLKISTSEKPTQNKKIDLTFILPILLILVGIGCMFINAIIGAILLVFAIVLGTVLISIKKKSSKQPSNNLLSIIEEKQNQLNKYLRLEKEISNGIDNFIARFNVGLYQDRYSALSTILNATIEKEKLNETLKTIEQNIKNLNLDESNFNRLNDDTLDINAKKYEIEKYQVEYTKKSNQLADKRANLVAQENYANSILDLQSKREDLIQNLQTYSENYKTLTATIDYLKKADETLKIKYRAPLQNSLNKYLTHITESALKAQIDIDLNVSVEEVDGVKSTDYYSKGYQNLFEICKRFALTDVLFKKEKPFIILDDPFYNLDDKKIGQAKKLINSLSEEYQIIYFVCHQSRA